MTDTLGTETEPEGGESHNIKVLREAAKERDELREQVTQMQRERAFEQSGIDLESGPGRLLMQAYQGEADPEKIKAEATAFGVPLKAAPVAETIEETTAPVTEDLGTADRSALAQGAPADTGQDKNPYVLAEEKATEIRSRGGTNDDEASAYLGTLVSAANSGDPRVTLDPRTGQRRVGQNV